MKEGVEGYWLAAESFPFSILSEWKFEDLRRAEAFHLHWS